MPLLTFNSRYFLFTIVLFFIEVLIALFVHDDFIRPYAGDYLVVILMYCGIRTFIRSSPLKIAVGVLLFSFFIEVLQYWNIVDKLGLAGNQVATTVIGNGFSWLDMLAYTLGVITVFVLDTLAAKKKLLANRSALRPF